MQIFNLSKAIEFFQVTFKGQMKIKLNLKMRFVTFPIKNFGWVLTLMLILHQGNVQVHSSENDNEDSDVQVQSEEGKLCYCRIIYLLSIFS